jgi:glycosyltransferase involved in cell wall biosynthesis
MKGYRKLSVCMLAHNPPYQGGIVQYSVLLSNHLKDKIDLKVIGFRSLYPPFLYKGKLPKKNRSGINFQVPHSNFVTWYNPLTWVKAYFVMSKADIIFLQWVSPLLTPLQYVILKLNNIFARKKVILTCHNIEPHESTIFDKWFTRAIFSLTDHFIVHAEQNKRRLIQHYKIKPNNVHIIPHGTFGFFTKWRKEGKKDLRKMFNYEQDDKVILFFGYIREYKGLRYLFRAMHKMIQKDKKIKLLVAGELWQNKNAYKKELKGLENYVRIIPRYILDNEVYRFFDVADICVLPYYNTEQTISGPLLVSLAFGKPTIVSPVGGIKEFLKDGEEVIFSPGGDVNKLSDDIIKLINDTDRQAKLTKKAIIKDKIFSWENVAFEYHSVMKKVMEN